jgi:hypothetical protein
MFGASQFMFTGGRSRLRPPDLAGAPFRPARRRPRRYDLARRYCPFACPTSCRSLAKLAGVVVFFELLITALARARYMATTFVRAVLQIVLGGVIVEATAILIFLIGAA